MYCTTGVLCIYEQQKIGNFYPDLCQGFGLQISNVSHSLINYNFAEDFGIFYKMCSRASRLNFTRESSFKGIPLDWTLANVFEDLDFRFSLAY